ncbi:MAG: response regulator transcription factor [Myxococcales bacterium]|nr:response regulator transcription factor [Myxococcales bacterium]
MSKLRVLLADDHPVVRSGLRAMIEALPDMAVVGEASDGESAVRQTAMVRPDVVVMDVSMPGMNGVEATRELHRRCPEVRVVALTAHEDRGYLQQLMAAGAAGFVLKRAAVEDLVRAIRDAAAGTTYIDPSVAAQVVAEPASDETPIGDALTEREIDVLRLVARSLLDREIAARLRLDAATVEICKLGAMAKLGLKTRASVVRHALQQGWLKNG